MRGWCFVGSCSSAFSAVANASVTTHSSWPVIPFLGISALPHDPALKHITVRSKEKPAGVNRLARPPRSLFRPHWPRRCRAWLRIPVFQMTAALARCPSARDSRSAVGRGLPGVRSARVRAVANVASEFSVQKVPPLFCATDRTRPNLGGSLGLVVSIKAFRQRANSEPCIRLYHLKLVRLFAAVLGLGS